MSTLDTLNKTGGWRLVGYTILGTWIIGSVGSAIANVIHGNEPIIKVIPPPGGQLPQGKLT